MPIATTAHCLSRYLITSEFSLEDLEGAAAILDAFAHHSREHRAANGGGSVASGTTASASRHAVPPLPRVWEPAVEACVSDAELRLYLLTDAQALRARAYHLGKVRQPPVGAGEVLGLLTCPC